MIANRCNDTTYVYNLPYISFQERIDKVLVSPRSRIQTRQMSVKLYSNIKTDEIRQEE